MSILFEDTDPELLALVYCRSRWGLEIEELPARLVIESPCGPSRRPPDPEDELVKAWRAAWAARLSHLDELDGATDAAERSRRFLSSTLVTDERWSDRFPEIFQDDAYGEWRDRLTTVTYAVADELEASFVRAWRNGLENFVLLPFAEPYAVPHGSNRILLSTASWNDHVAMQTLLETWPSASR